MNEEILHPITGEPLPPRRAKAVRLFRQGLTSSEIAKHIGIERRSVNSMLREAGVRGVEPLAPSPWEAHDAELKRLWARGHSGSQIAKMIGPVAGVQPSRSAVISRLHRLGYAGRHAPAKPEKVKPPRPPKAVKPPKPPKEPKPPRAPKAPPVKREPYQNAGINFGKQRPVERPMPTSDPAVQRDVVRLELLSTHACRWPIGDPRDATFGFCGEHAGEGGPYCHTHHRKSRQAGTAQGQTPTVKSMRRYG